MAYSRYLKSKRTVRAYQQKTIQIHKDSLDKIRSHKDTKQVKYEDFPAAFEYIDRRFPKINIKEAKVFLAKRSFLDRIGYKGIGGFYSRIEKVVIIPDKMPEIKTPKGVNGKPRWKTIKANITTEEILVHELCHYVSGRTSSTNKTMQIEEEFAYGNMVDFCRSLGRTDEDIIRNIFMPYLVGVILSNKQTIFCETDEQDKILFEAVTKESYDLGKKIIDIWDEKNSILKHKLSEISQTKKTLNLDFE